MQTRSLMLTALILAASPTTQAAPVTLTFTAIVSSYEALGPGSWQPVPEALGTAITGSVTYDVTGAMTTESIAAMGIDGSFWRSQFGCYRLLADGSCAESFGPGTPILVDYSADVEFGAVTLAPLIGDAVWQQFSQARVMSPTYGWGLSTYEASYSPVYVIPGSPWYSYDETVTSFGLGLRTGSPGLLYSDPGVIALPPQLSPEIDGSVYGSSFTQPLYCSAPPNYCGPLGGSGYRFAAQLTSLSVDDVQKVPEPSTLVLLLGAGVLAMAGRRRAPHCPMG